MILQRYKSGRSVIEVEAGLVHARVQPKARKGSARGSITTILPLLPVLLHMHSCTLQLVMSCAGGENSTNATLTAFVAAVLLEQWLKCMNLAKQKHKSKTGYKEAQKQTKYKETQTWNRHGYRGNVYLGGTITGDRSPNSLRALSYTITATFLANTRAWAGLS